MNLVEITEPTPEKKQKNFAIGIDLGTTNSLLAITDEHGTRFLQIDGKNYLPSIVTFLENKDIYVGKIISEQGISVQSIKRLMGKNFDEAKLLKVNFDLAKDQQNMSLVKIYDKYYSPAEISAKILSKLRYEAENMIGETIENVVITVPAYFDDLARNATKQAAQLAGLNVIRLVNEPTAAALAYNLDNSKEGIYIIYDLGGGTFDISILKMHKSIFKVIATNGDVNLGGDDIDNKIVEYILKKGKIEGNLGNFEKNRLKDIAKQIKETLSNIDICHVKFEFKDQLVEFSLTSEELDKILEEIINKTILILQETVKFSGIKLEEIEAIILVGGSTHIPKIKNSLKKIYNIKIFDELNPDEIVAYGASLHAKTLTIGQGNLLLDVNPLSLGLEVLGGVNDKIIKRNSPIPISVTQEFTTFEDNQSKMQFHVIQGESQFAKNCRSLAYFEIENIPPKKAGLARIKVMFTIDADGILKVSSSGENEENNKYIEIRPYYQLSSDEIKKILSDDYNIDTENNINFLSKAKSEARVKITQLNNLIEDAKIDINITERDILKNQLKDLVKIIDNNDIEIIRKEITNFEQKNQDFLKKALNNYLGSSLNFSEKL